jgi:hypothetical protein
VLDTTIDKLLTREYTRILELKTRLLEQCARFEESYALKSADFYERYQQGQMSDELDFIEWASTIEMLANIEKRLGLLNITANP